jgi:hypothetical protein
MNAKRIKTLQGAEDAFYKTTHGSVQEKEALTDWRNLCETEEEEWIPISAYLRRKQEAKVAAKKAARRNQPTPQKAVKHERKPETQAAPKTTGGRGKKSIRPPWWHNY